MMRNTCQVSFDGVGTKGLAELDRHIKRDPMEVWGGIMGEGQGLLEEDESRVNKASEDFRNSHGGVSSSSAHQSGPQKQQQPIIRWERFLPVRVLNVLLVENDDSTRQVISALLRNCSYEVTVAANGLQAWKILEDLSIHIDAVLTEVVMPSLSGIGLLHKIMSHKTCKNIPVIMMSSNDSMGTVFKCLSEGAVDFLVKPIRKNELKNLWQHVWRRCHSSRGSGSESDNQTQKPAKSKSADDLDNNTGSNDEDASEGIGMNAKDGSDNGSGTQSSWTKRAAPRSLHASDHLADPHDNNCVGVIHPTSETLSMTADTECLVTDESADQIGAISSFTSALNGSSKDSQGKDAAIDGSKESPSLDLSLKPIHDARSGALRHSNHSAFYRYHTPVAAPAAVDTRVEAVKTESKHNPMSTSGKNGSNGSNVGSTTTSFFTKPAPSVFHPVNIRTPAVQTAAMEGQLGGKQDQVQHNHHHRFHVNSNGPSLQKMAADILCCGTSNVFVGSMEGIVGSYSLNPSNDHGSSGGGGNLSGVDSNRFAQREAALNKFRQKRKERNFQKKVRYQSRKRLAEQRPRVHGQFVRQYECSPDPEADS